VPSREKYVSVVAVASPVFIAVGSGPDEGFTVVPRQVEEGVEVLQFQLLDSFPGAPDIFQWFFVAVLVHVLKLTDRVTNTN